MDDPLHRVFNDMVNQYIRLFENASNSERIEYLSGFSQASVEQVKRLFSERKYQEVCQFWERCYRGLDLSRVKTSDEASYFIQEQNYATSSLLFCAKRKEASTNINDIIEFCERIRKDCPWEWYLNDAYTGFCFETASAWEQLGESEQSQSLLKRAWEITLRRLGKESLLTNYPVLPLKGEVPEGASAEDRKFFKKFGPDKDKQESIWVEFIIQADVSGTKYPFELYVLEGPRGYLELQDQIRWVKERRGGEIPIDIQNRFQKLNKTAMEKKVDSMELCVYELGKDGKEKSTSNK